MSRNSWSVDMCWIDEINSSGDLNSRIKMLSKYFKMSTNFKKIYFCDKKTFLKMLKRKSMKGHFKFILHFHIKIHWTTVGLNAEETEGWKWSKTFRKLDAVRVDAKTDGKHMAKVSNFVLYVVMIGCNEINFYCKFIDTAKTRKQTSERRTAHGWNI